MNKEIPLSPCDPIPYYLYHPFFTVLHLVENTGKLTNGSQLRTHNPRQARKDNLINQRMKQARQELLT